MHTTTTKNNRNELTVWFVVFSYYKFEIAYISIDTISNQSLRKMYLTVILFEWKLDGQVSVYVHASL